MEMDNIHGDFHSSLALEPDVIINDDIGECHYQNNRKSNYHNYHNPEISIIPIKAPDLVKIIPNRSKHFLNNYGLIAQKNLRQSSNISRESSELEISSIKRKSLPLEKCPICKKYFRRMKTHLQKHEDIKPDPNNPLTCQYCMKSFNTGSNLSIHMRTHTGDKPYICEVCLKGFAQSCNLINHMRIHTGERPYKCPHCDRAFTQSGNLSNHVRLHTDEKPFKCHFCDKAFTQSGNLNSHIRNNHKCFNVQQTS